MKNNSQNVTSETQFSVFLANKPGMLAQVLQRLVENKVHILALSMMDSTEHGVLRFVTDGSSKVREALDPLDLFVTETAVLSMKLPSRSDALADVVERLATAHINVNYAYCTSGARGGKTLGIFKVSDAKKATKVLSSRRPRRKRVGPALRSSSPARRK